MIKKQIQISIVLLFILLSLFSQNGSAFIIPDITAIGTDPEITSFSTTYLIPGNKVKIIGNGFFEYPKSANKLRINNSPIRITSVTKNEIEFIVPRIPLGKAQVRFHTSYLGYKSKEIVYPSNEKDFLYLALNAPEINHANITSVKPDSEILVYGSFMVSYPIYFQVNDETIKASIISKELCKIKLPKKLPIGPFTLRFFYKKFASNTNQYTESARSTDFLFYNTEAGIPKSVKIKLQQNNFNSRESLNKEYPYQVELIFNDLKNTANITNYAQVILNNKSDNDILEINPITKTFKLKNEGTAKLYATFTWLPTNLTLQDETTIAISSPQKPRFKEVIINEVFPFATPAIQATDANNDGFARTSDDFIEIKNVINNKVDLTGCKIVIDDSKLYFEFSQNTFLSPNTYFAIFGRSTNLNLPSSGATIELLCDNNSIDYSYYPGGKAGDPSWQRKNDLTGFIKHPNKLFSPGEAFEENILMADNIQPSTIKQLPLPLLNSTSVSNLQTLELKEITAIPNTLLFEGSQTQQLTIFAEYLNGEKKDITNECSFKVSPQDTIIKLEPNGLVKPLANGTATIEISFENKILEIIANVNFISKVQPKQLIINEVLAAPILDTNKDSIFKSDQDEFIEIVNVSGIPLDLTNLIISDNIRSRHIIPAGTILNNLEPLIIFGGGSSSAFSSEIKSQTASTSSLSLNNTGQEQVTISTSTNQIIDQIIFDNANLQGISLNRLPDLSFNTLIAHNKLLKAIDNFSPGTRIDNSLFSTPPQDGLELLKSSSSSGIISTSSGNFFISSSSSTSSGTINPILSSSSSSGLIIQSSSSSSSGTVNSTLTSSSSGLITQSSSSSSSSGTLCNHNDML